MRNTVFILCPFVLVNPMYVGLRLPFWISVVVLKKTVYRFDCQRTGSLWIIFSVNFVSDVVDFFVVDYMGMLLD